MVLRKRKYESGAATNYISRNQCLKKLQVSLADFRRLSILKGIYPHEPRHPKKVGKGSTMPKTYYLLKDIQFMAQEPIINKFREMKAFLRRLKKAHDKKETGKVDRMQSNRPFYRLDHIVRERYPQFEDSLRDLDDCLTLTMLFATFPKGRRSHTAAIAACRRRTVEFMHYVIASRSLRKVFISIKGIYYQADIQGETVTWVSPHSRSFQQPGDVDFKIMSTFVEFYRISLGFVNQKLYTTLGLYYPPKLLLPEEEDDSEMCSVEERLEERMAAMTQTLTSKTPLDEVVELDEFPVEESDNPDLLEKARAEQAEVAKLRRLFEGLKFFISRESPRESLTFVIRSFGGVVSWEKTLALGATYSEADETITHQIVDRPKLATQHLSRTYVQPQWVYDCVNARRLLPNAQYAPGAKLPPHLSPFTTDNDDAGYQPPEALRLKGLKPALQEEEEEEEEEEEQEEEGGEESGSEEEEEVEKAFRLKSGRGRGDGDDEDDEDASDEEEEEKDEPVPTKKRKAEEKKKSMSVTRGRVEREDAGRRREKEATEQRKLQEMMIPKKKRRLYNKIRHSQKKVAQEKRHLEEKRKAYDKEERKAARQKGTKP